jgi:two-component system sensor histidine kinase RegB
MGLLGKDDQYVKVVDFFTLLFEACQPFKKLEKRIVFRLNGVRQGHEAISIKEKMIPLVRREPELIHGIRNIIHNALKFSNSLVDINLIVDSGKINLEITDDGKGFPHDLQNMIGEPFLKRSDKHLVRAKDKTFEEGMGLGLFIAKILLERTKGKLNFSNINQIEYDSNIRKRGAKVEISWARSTIEVVQGDEKTKMKDNPKNVS